MIKVRVDTIVKPGDILIQPGNNDKWEVNKIEGRNFFMSHVQSKSTKVISKFDLVTDPAWSLEIKDNRGYW